MPFNPFAHLTTRQKQIAGRVGKAALVGALMASGAAFADTDPVATNITSLQASVITDIGLVVAAAFAVLVASLVPDIGLGLAKKWIKKGAS
ncbi:MAG: hypothetical protein JWP80_373 [Pseudomonas sp.]|nr:hypothetical protein [Pseudomonas sp.]